MSVLENLGELDSLVDLDSLENLDSLGDKIADQGRADGAGTVNKSPPQVFSWRITNDNELI